MSVEQEVRAERPTRSVHSCARVGIWSADYTAITGQALVTARVIRLLAQQSPLECVYRGSGVGMFVSWLAASFKLWYRSARGEVDTLYLVCSRSRGGFLRDIPAYLAAACGIRTVVHVHGSDIVDMFGWRHLGRLARWSLKLCEIIVPSRHLDEPLCQLGITRVHLCENFIEAACGPVTPSVLPRTVVFWNSNIMASKGFFAVASAVEKLNSEGLPIKLVAIGRPLSDEVMSLDVCASSLRQFCQRSWLDYLGPVDRPRAITLMQDAHVVCFPSTYKSECQPLAIIEAMCAGRAVIIANTPALRATVGTYPVVVLQNTASNTVAYALAEFHTVDTAAAARCTAAIEARERFSAERFDKRMREILALPPWS